MIIGFDAGALCQKSITGNLIFTLNLIEALSRVDNKNQYYLYHFCSNKKKIVTGKNIYLKKLWPKLGWLKFRVSLEEIVNKKDIFLAINQTLPLYTPAKIIAFSHGFSFYFYSKFYPDSAKKMFRDHQIIINKADKIIVPSIRVKNEMKKIFLENQKIEVINYGVPFDVLLSARRMKNKNRKKFFLAVGMNHPIKNFPFITKVFKEFKKRYPDYQLLIVHKKNRKQLINLYKEATALLTASYYESFNFPVLEALALSCPVIGLRSAIIPEMRSLINLADNKEDFIKKMVEVAQGKKTIIDKEKLLKKFSWLSYAEKLISLYEKT